LQPLIQFFVKGDVKLLYRSGAAFARWQRDPTRWSEQCLRAYSTNVCQSTCSDVFHNWVSSHEKSRHAIAGGISGQTLGRALYACGVVQLAQGQRARAQELWRQLAELAERTRAATVGLFAARSEVILASLDGHLDEAVVLLRRLVDYADESACPSAGDNPVTCC
jgi:hypothetical protein